MTSQRSGPPLDLVVVGCPSMDRLVIDDDVVEVAGGSGFNTALAARRAGVNVGLVAAIPRDLSAEIAVAFGPGGIDRGGLVVRNGISPSFQIAYDADLNADYLGIELGVEMTMSGGDFPEAWLGAQHVHIGPLGASSERQLAFARRLRERGFEGQLSAGAFLDDVADQHDVTLELIGMCSLFFMNQAESDSLYPAEVAPAARQQLCVTEGSNGVTIHEGTTATRYDPPVVEVVDPTGAGDAFAGGYLAGVITGADPIESGNAAAACALSGPGSSALIKAVSPRVEQRVRVDEQQIRRVATMLADKATASTLDFCGFPFPDEGIPWALDCLAVATIHEYGFWYSDDDGWTESMYALGNGQRFKGSDFIWQAFTRAATEDPTILEPRRLANELDLFDRICAADDGTCPVPQLDSHRQLQQAYGEALIEAGHGGFSDLLTHITSQDRPGRALLDRLTRLPGYAEDPMAKKANLLLIILANRPERFIDLRDPEVVTPIVDYHLMRSCLRTGCVTILDPELQARVENRRWVDELEEDLIRKAAFDAINLLVEHSGLSQAAVDGFFFTNARSTCVEATEPTCETCRAEAACAKRTSLFQPVLRTTAY